MNHAIRAATVERSTTTRRPRIRRSRPKLERLESRVLCAVGIDNPTGTNSGTVDTGGQSASPVLAPFLTVVSSSIPPGASLATSPDTITIRFDRPIDPGSFGNDFVLQRLNEDGSETSVFDNGPIYSEAPDASGCDLAVTLNQALPPGHYQFFVSGSSGLAGMDGSMLNPSGNDQLVGDFFVRDPGLSFSKATDLGTPGSVPVAAPGNLDLTSTPSAVDLYKIELPAGHLWQLGLEVSATRDGSSLSSSLGLFDSQGNPIATSSQGRTDFPGDPYLFFGLPGGTYYVGVSGKGNLPGSPGGYNLVTGSSGSLVQSQAGGKFTLHVVANPADRPISVQTFTVDRADPLDKTPTGLTLGFSGSLRMGGGDSATPAASLSRGVQVVDQTGRVWPLTATAYSEAEARISFLFSDRLPPGQYTVRFPQQGSLVDLAGQTPVVPGQPAGVIGRFSVIASASTHDPHDLGALSPNQLLAGVSVDTMISHAESVTYRFVITYAFRYSLETRFSGGTLSVEMSNQLGTYALDPALLNTSNANLVRLLPGVYTVTLTSTSVRPFLVTFNLRSPSTSLDSLLGNGVGQGPALNLRLISPTVLATDTTVAAPSDTAGSTAGAPIFAPAATLPASSPGDTVMAAGWSYGFFRTSFVGRPDTSSSHIGSTDRALASIGSFADVGARPGQRPIDQRGSFADGGFFSQTEPSEVADGVPKNGAMVGGLSVAGPVLAESRAFGMSWLDSSAVALARQADAQAGAAAATADGITSATELAAAQPAEIAFEPEAIQQASLAAPIGVGVVAGLVMLYRRQLRDWMERMRGRSSARMAAKASGQRGGKTRADQAAHSPKVHVGQYRPSLARDSSLPRIV